MESSLDKLRKKFGEKIEVFEKSKKRVYVSVERANLKDVLRFLSQDLGARMSIATGVDTRIGIELIYHMAFDEEGLFVSVRVMVEKPDPSIATVTDVIPAAMWIEREIHEMFGVDFPGHPNLERLLLPDDWEDGVYPFRKKSFDSEHEGVDKDA